VPPKFYIQKGCREPKKVEKHWFKDTDRSLLLGISQNKNWPQILYLFLMYDYFIQKECPSNLIKKIMILIKPLDFIVIGILK